DAWAGAFTVSDVNRSGSYRTLGHTHGMSGDARRTLKANYQEELLSPFFEKQRELLRLPEYRLLTTMRTKMTMLQFLVNLPPYYGFETYSPFLEQDIALDMLNLPAERRANRQWQRDFFKKHNVL